MVVEGCGVSASLQKLASQLRRPDPTADSSTASTEPLSHHAKHLEQLDGGGLAGNPRLIFVGIHQLQLYELDVLAGTFKVRMGFHLNWYDPAFATGEYREAHNMSVECTTRPVVTFGNCVDALETPDGWDFKTATGYGEPAAASLRADISPGHLRSNLHVTGVFDEEMELLEFPFDVQCLTIKLRLWGGGVEQTSDYGRLLLGAVTARHLRHLRRMYAPAIRTTAPSPGPLIHQKQALEVTMIVQRKSAHYLRTVVLPLFGLTSMTFFAFILEPADLADRQALVVTMLLTVVAFKLVVADALPKLSYSTRLDTYMEGCFITIFAIAIENAIHAVQDIGRVGVVLCVVVWLLANIHLAVCYASMRWRVARTLGRPLNANKPVVSIDSILDELAAGASPRPIAAEGGGPPSAVTGGASPRAADVLL